ncbi:MAG: type 4a pilus biogenesis protein PilO [Candidatus Hatepunaea meridiana]|nr:type 4a pilus biogenesis protein PilO [Candidatus Hatepunaea meridiana]
MKRNLILLIILVLFGGSAWGYYNWVYSEYPQKIRQFDRTIQLRDEKLISAQIIHQQLDLVANLIEKNLAFSKSDSLAEIASLPFINYVTGILEELKIDMNKLEPGKKSARLDYVRVPYTLTLDASYQQLGKFINRLEKSERLITVEQFEIDNAIRKSGAKTDKTQDRSIHEIVLKISTLTLIKQR